MYLRVSDKLPNDLLFRAHDTRRPTAMFSPIKIKQFSPIHRKEYTIVPTSRHILGWNSPYPFPDRHEQIRENPYTLLPSW